MGNSAHVPGSHKDEVYKTDSRDARGIGRALVHQQVKGIYIPTEEQQADRHLMRQRKKICRDPVRCKNRIKVFLDYTGTTLSPHYDNSKWSKNFINWLVTLEFEHHSNRVTLHYQVTELELLRKELLKIKNLFFGLASLNVPGFPLRSSGKDLQCDH